MPQDPAMASIKTATVSLMTMFSSIPIILMTMEWVWINSSIQSCSQPNGYVTNSSDCDDGNSAIVNASEVCDGVDQNCNGAIDDGVPTSTYYLDGDGDPFGSNSTQSCAQPMAMSRTQMTVMMQTVPSIPMPQDPAMALIKTQWDD